MTLPSDAGSESRKARAFAALENDPASVVKIGPEEFRVKSSSGRGNYLVRLVKGDWRCECDDWGDRQRACYHVAMVRDVCTSTNGPVVQVVVEQPRPKYTQRWPPYDAAQKAVHRVSDAYLWDLLRSVDEPGWAPSDRGRRPNSLRLRLLLAIRKVQLGMTTREVDGMFHLLADGGRWILRNDQLPNSTDSSRLFNQERISPILLQPIERVGLLVLDIEEDGTVAVDSTGFCTSCRGAYLGETHGVSHAHRWVKCHAIVGTRTHMVLGVRVTAENCNDYPQFIPLVMRIAELGFAPRVVAADKGYLGRSNLQTCADLGFDPKIPFKAGSRERSKGCPMWWKQYHQFMLHHDDWEADYHARSNVESTFSAIKRKLGEPLLSKNELARFNELLAKVLAYNLSVVVHEIFKRGLDPGLDLNTLNSLPIERGEGVRTAWETIPRPGNQLVWNGAEGGH
jgi:transposase